MLRTRRMLKSSGECFCFCVVLEALKDFLPSGKIRASVKFVNGR
jgi:hypothetical protein